MQQNTFFPEIRGKFGFGCMRLPKRGEEIDLDAFSAMADAFLDAGFNYFDTAHLYLGGKSEPAFRDCVAKRHKRSEYLLTDKLTTFCFERQEEIRPLFETQLKQCGVEYFDFYLMHAQNARNYEKFQRCRAYETAYALKEEGLFRHFGLSFHDKAEMLDRILAEHPEVEIVQIQLNYADMDSLIVESRKVYEVCEKYDKPVIVMEPVKGGSLVNLPEAADRILRELHGGSNASYALRYAASFPKVAMVLSGMSDLAQMQDNLDTMRDFKPPDAAEQDAIARVCEVLQSLQLIPCTACRYCMDEGGCPKAIRIPEILAARNTHEVFHNWNTKYYYNTVLTVSGHGKASDCIGCGHCESVCPQHLPIRELLRQTAELFEN